MAFSTGENSITLSELKEKVSDSQICIYYLGITKIPCLIPSPLRVDRKPSVGLYSRDGVNIYWTDFATKENGSIYDLLSKMWKCSFKETINKINSDLHSFTNGSSISKSCPCKIINISNNKVELKCKVREWRDYDIEYWESYGVPLEWLKYAEVYPISHKIIVNGNKTFVLGADKYAYAYVERKEGKITLKIYQPFNKNGYKWSNKHDKSVISLWTKIPESGDKLVICSSLKDALCLWANIGIPAVAVQGEGYGISNTALVELKKRYKDTLILFDNDEAGLIDGKKLASETGFTNVVLPKFKGGKDISDLYKSVGKYEFKKIMNNLLYNKKDDTL